MKHDLGRCEHFRARSSRRYSPSGRIEPRRRTALFARYSVIGSCSTALGVLAAAFPGFAAASIARTRAAAMQLMFGDFAILGSVAFLLYRPLSVAVKIAKRLMTAPLGPSKRLVYGMAALFGMDSFGTGFLVQSLVALWLYQAFHVSVTTTATILFLGEPVLSGVLSACRAARGARRADQHDGVFARLPWTTSC